ncbi:bifunctional 2-polyprenyl-6-hydroxyphenol methylase/3-demethylubiquinol 3-O-methyltransferase UbiG [Desulfonatronum sp. SC1]|uniref:class I SAM-dependent methyltransferase n=1 Tax=Desulfonatronum sp. SC1 TaxID=2109626 RepID=UPI000D31732C|nr:class I SAM-dependent methyltransferase [Desulfonatronum sp. SC1]PTN36490.1 class I SAM-dependent methyltransferase [Desulfonatronum sp. SC1]
MIQCEYARIYALENDYWWYRGLHELVEAILRTKSSNFPDCRILDAGCGTGRMMQIAATYGHVQGLDRSREAVSFCIKNDLYDVYCQDLNNWVPEEHSYDVIISLDVLYHAAVASDADIVHAFYSALRPGGLCIVNLPAFPVLFRNHDLAVHTKRRYRKKPAVQLFKEAGFTVTQASYRLPHLFVVILLKKILQSVVGAKEESDLQKLPGWLNRLLLRMVRAENRLILSGRSMPFGSSLFLVAQKQTQEAA